MTKNWDEEQKRRKWLQDIKRREAEIREGFCEDDKLELAEMTLKEIADELELPMWLLIRMVETVEMSNSLGREEKYRRKRAAT